MNRKLVKMYVGEFVDIDGEAKQIITDKLHEVMSILRNLKDGEALVINCTEENRFMEAK